jgi:O-succinylbenzoate synthase
LDEELIGKITLDGKRDLLSTTLPQYIIIKPALSGGFTNSQDWINEANKLKIGWWITSALESNIGLNAIAQWTYSLNTTNKQGLGTGNLYKNNIHSPLYTKGQELFINPEVEWDKTALNYYE